MESRCTASRAEWKGRSQTSILLTLVIVERHSASMGSTRTSTSISPAVAEQGIKMPGLIQSGGIGGVDGYGHFEDTSIGFPVMND